MEILSLPKSLDLLRSEWAIRDDFYDVFIPLRRMQVRDWFYTISAPDGRLVLHIQSNPALTVKDLELILDGSAPTLFSGSAIVFCSDGKSFRSDLSNLPKFSNDIQFLPAPAAIPGLSLIEFNENCVPPSASDQSALQRALQERSFLGSKLLTFSEKQKKISIQKFATRHEFLPRPQEFFPENNPKIEVKRTLAGVGGEYLGECIISIGYCMDVLKRVVIREKYHGISPVPQQIIDCISSRSFERCAVFIEFIGSGLRTELNGELGPRERTDSIYRTISQLLRELRTSPSLDGLQHEINHVRAVRASERLICRQKQVSERRRVYYKNTFLCLEPRSENEVLLLLSKLSVLNGTPLKIFTISEYTPREGIDSLCDIQVFPASMLEYNVPVELEYHFENFNDHGHPKEQVRMIVCWSFRLAATRKKEEMKAISPGLYSLTIDTATILVLVLSECPDIALKSIKRGKT